MHMNTTGITTPNGGAFACVRSGDRLLRRLPERSRSHRQLTPAGEDSALSGHDPPAPPRLRVLSAPSCSVPRRAAARHPRRDPRIRRPLSSGIHHPPFGKRTIMNTLLAPQRPSGIPDTLRLPSRAPAPRSSTASPSTSGCDCCIWGTRTPRLSARPRRSTRAPPRRRGTRRPRARLHPRGTPRTPAVTATGVRRPTEPGDGPPSPDPLPHTRRTHHEHTLTQIEFRPLVIPESIDADDAADFREMVRVRNLVYREISGHDDDSHRRRRTAPPPQARRVRAAA